MLLVFSIRPEEEEAEEEHSNQVASLDGLLETGEEHGRAE